MEDVNNWYVRVDSAEEAKEVIELALKLGARLVEEVGPLNSIHNQYRWDRFGCWGVKEGSTLTGEYDSPALAEQERISMTHLRDYVKSATTPAHYQAGDEVGVVHDGRSKGLCKIKYIGALYGIYSNSQGEFAAPLMQIKYEEPKVELPMEQQLFDVISELKTNALYVEVSSMDDEGVVELVAGYGDNLDHLVGNVVSYCVDLNDLPEMLSLEDQAKGILEELVERLGKYLFIKKEAV